MRRHPLLTARTGLRRSETLARAIGTEERLRVENDAGSIEITAWERDDLEVVAHKHAPDEAGLALLEVELTETDDGIRVGYSSNQVQVDAWVDFSIRAPRGLVLDLQNVAGGIRMTGFTMQARATTVSGAVEGWALAGTIQVRTASGQVGLHGGVLGRVHVETVSGDTQVDGLDGTIEAHSTSGSIAVEGRLSGKCALGSVSGGIAVRLLQGSQLTPGSVPASSVSGAVEVVAVG